MSDWCVYILHCADDTLYTGVTNDTDRRVHEHNHSDRLGAKYTRIRRPVRLIYKELYETRSEACIREADIKKMSREQKIELTQS